MAQNTLQTPDSQHEADFIILEGGKDDAALPDQRQQQVSAKAGFKAGSLRINFQKTKLIAQIIE